MIIRYNSGARSGIDIEKAILDKLEKNGENIHFKVKGKFSKYMIS